MIVLVLTVCAATALASCEDTRLPFASQESLMQCTMRAPPFIAAWAEDHPGRRVTRWRCVYPGAEGEKT